MTDRPPPHKPPDDSADPLASPGLHQGPIEYLPRSFTMTLEERVRARAGTPAWMRRARHLERHRAELEAALEEAWRDSSPSAWEAQARSWDLSVINQEILSYNAYFPVERGLGMDPALRDFTHAGERWQPLPELDADWILSAYPPAQAGNPPRRG